jgi:radical SAM superfamily enzyme YgiQ (UPF0313 family)
MTSKSWQWMNAAPAIGLYRLKTCLNRAGMICDILDFDIDSETDYEQRVAMGFYNVIGMSLTHVNLEEDLNTIFKFRQLASSSGKKVIFIAGGQEATLNYKPMLYSGMFDVIFLGFAEDSLVDFMLKHATGTYQDVSSIAQQLDGVAFRDHNDVCCYRPARRLTSEHFRTLSYENVVSSHIPYQRYWSRVRENLVHDISHAKFIVETARLYTSSHCPRKCGFCSSQAFLPDSQKSLSPILMLSADEVFSLVKNHIHAYGAKGFLFSDDDFPIGTKQGISRVINFCEHVINAKKCGEIPHDVQYFCQARIADFLMNHQVRFDLIDSMSKAGFDNIGLGVETFCERLLQVPSVNKVGISVNDCRNVLDALLENKITPIIYIILGIPESSPAELLESIQQAVEYIRKGADVRVNQRMNVYPGSPAERKGAIDIVRKNWRCPQGHKQIEIEEYFVPADRTVARVIDSVAEKGKSELNIIKSNRGWNKDYIPKCGIGLAYFIAVAKLLDRHDLAEEFAKVFDEIS